MNSVFNERFWQTLDTIAHVHSVVIDRPAGSLLAIRRLSILSTTDISRARALSTGVGSMFGLEAYGAKL